MPHRLAFGTLYEYDTLESGITIPVALSVGAQVVDLFAKDDTGAAYCILQREFGEDLGLDIEQGASQSLRPSLASDFAHVIRNCTPGRVNWALGSSDRKGEAS